MITNYIEIIIYAMACIYILVTLYELHCSNVIFCINFGHIVLDKSILEFNRTSQ